MRVLEQHFKLYTYYISILHNYVLFNTMANPNLFSTLVEILDRCKKSIYFYLNFRELPPSKGLAILR